MTSRSVLAGNGQLNSTLPLTRLLSLRSKPRARNTDSLVCSATETRDILPLLSPDHGVSGPRPEDSEGLVGGQLWIICVNSLKSAPAPAPGGRQRSRRGRPCAAPDREDRRAG